MGRKDKKPRYSNRIMVEVWREPGGMVNYSVWRDGKVLSQNEPDLPALSLNKLYLQIEEEILSK